MPQKAQRENHATLKRKRRLYDQLIGTNSEISKLGSPRNRKELADRERLVSRRIKIAAELGINLHAAIAVATNPIPRPSEKNTSERRHGFRAMPSSV